VVVTVDPVAGMVDEDRVAVVRRRSQVGRANR
jgi:hypothetical protein